MRFAKWTPMSPTSPYWLKVFARRGTRSPADYRVSTGHELHIRAVVVSEAPVPGVAKVMMYQVVAFCQERCSGLRTLQYHMAVR